MFDFLDSCSLNNQVYSFSKNQKCTKVGTREECQLTCQQTDGCTKFSFFTRDYKTSNDAENYVRREALDCCLVADTKSTSTVTKKQNVISGPKFCPSRKSEMETRTNKSNRNDLFTCKLNPLMNILLLSRNSLTSVLLNAVFSSSQLNTLDTLLVSRYRWLQITKTDHDLVHIFTTWCVLKIYNRLNLDLKSE